MRFTLRKLQAASLGGLAVAAAGKRDRPILCGVLFAAEVVEGQIKVSFTVTDSYRLAQQFFVFDAEDQDFEPFEALFDAKQLASLLKKAKSNSDRVLFEVEPAILGLAGVVEDDRVGTWSKPKMEVRVFTNTGNISGEVEYIEGKFPDIKSLMREIPWDTNWVSENLDQEDRLARFVREVAAHQMDQENGPDDVLENDDALDGLESFISEARSLRDGGYIEPAKNTVALNATYLSQMAEALGAKGSGIPVQLLVRRGRKPMAFKHVENGQISGRGILMPVRI